MSHTYVLFSTMIVNSELYLPFLELSKCFSPFPNNTFLHSSKLKETAHNNLKFDENGGEFPERLENTVVKGEIARYEHFLLFPQSFQKTCATDT